MLLLLVVSKAVQARKSGRRSAGCWNKNLYAVEFPSNYSIFESNMKGLRKAWFPLLTAFLSVGASIYGQAPKFLWMENIGGRVFSADNEYVYAQTNGSVI